MNLLFEQLAKANKRIKQLTGEIERTRVQSETSQRLATIPGVGMLSATIIAATTTSGRSPDQVRGRLCSAALSDFFYA